MVCCHQPGGFVLGCLPSGLVHGLRIVICAFLRGFDTVIRDTNKFRFQFDTKIRICCVTSKVLGEILSAWT